MASFNHFLRDDRGSQSVEFMLWLPLIAVLLVAVTDASFIYLNHTEMWNVARDTARRMSSGQIRSKEAAEEYAGSQLCAYSNPQVSATYDPASMMTVVVGIDMTDAMVLGGFLGRVIGRTLVARVAMRPDPQVASLGGVGDDETFPACPTGGKGKGPKK